MSIYITDSRRIAVDIQEIDSNGEPVNDNDNNPKTRETVTDSDNYPKTPFNSARIEVVAFLMRNCTHCENFTLNTLPIIEQMDNVSCQCFYYNDVPPKEHDLARLLYNTPFFPTIYTRRMESNLALTEYEEHIGDVRELPSHLGNMHRQRQIEG